MRIVSLPLLLRVLGIDLGFAVAKFVAVHDSVLPLLLSLLPLEPIPCLSVTEKTPGVGAVSDRGSELSPGVCDVVLDR